MEAIDAVDATGCATGAITFDIGDAGNADDAGDGTGEGAIGVAGDGTRKGGVAGDGTRKGGVGAGIGTTREGGVGVGATGDEVYVWDDISAGGDAAGCSIAVAGCDMGSKEDEDAVMGVDEDAVMGVNEDEDADMGDFFFIGANVGADSSAT